MLPDTTEFSFRRNDVAPVGILHKPYNGGWLTFLPSENCGRPTFRGFRKVENSRLNPRDRLIEAT